MDRSHITSSSSSSSIKCTTELIVAGHDDNSDNDEMSDDNKNMRNNKNDEPALILKGPRDVTALVGERVLLKAVYMGRPVPNVKWTRAVSCFLYFIMYYVCSLF